jgi:geranylgeranyl diphosphate synthase type II
MTREEFAAQFENLRRLFEEFLPSTLEILPQSRLQDAVSHVLLGGGKRLRPVLCLAAARVSPRASMRRTAALHAAAALEWMHTYSLVHDDLPALDNDDWRRGRPTLHKLYDEATAILAGDALHAGAFVLAGRAHLPGQRRGVAAVACTGVFGMVQGQAVDTLPAARPEIMTSETLFSMIDGKTGAMMAVCMEMGAIAGGVTDTTFWRRYGLLLGRCFQIRDDQLDVSGTLQELGKTPGKDAAQKKSSAVAVLGPAVGEILRSLYEETCRAADALPWESEFFRHVAALAVQRTK